MALQLIVCGAGTTGSGAAGRLGSAQDPAAAAVYTTNYDAMNEPTIE
jgi:hypothetical protein